MEFRPASSLVSFPVALAAAFLSACGPITIGSLPSSQTSSPNGPPLSVFTGRPGDGPIRATSATGLIYRTYSLGYDESTQKADFVGTFQTGSSGGQVVHLDGLSRLEFQGVRATETGYLSDIGSQILYNLLLFPFSLLLPLQYPSSRSRVHYRVSTTALRSDSYEANWIDPQGRSVRDLIAMPRIARAIVRRNPQLAGTSAVNVYFDLDVSGLTQMRLVASLSQGTRTTGSSASTAILFPGDSVRSGFTPLALTFQNVVGGFVEGDARLNYSITGQMALQSGGNAGGVADVVYTAAPINVTIGR